jgi:hypothetical protein
MTTELAHQYTWSNGDKPERSYKPIKSSGENRSEENQTYNRTEDVGDYFIENPNIKKPGRQDAIQYALATSEKSEPSGKRDDMNHKLTERAPVASISINPFLRNSNYLHDMETRDNFLVPKNSNQELNVHKR